MTSLTSTSLGRLAGGLADFIGPFNRGDLPPYAMVRYIKCCSAHLDGRLFASIHLVETPRKSVMAALPAWATLLRARGSNGGAIRVDALRQIRFVTTRDSDSPFIRC